MEAVATDFGIQEALNQLGVKAINEGTSTGSNNFSNGKIIESYSPVDGSLIGKVKTTSKEDYEEHVSGIHDAYDLKKLADDHWIIEDYNVFFEDKIFPEISDCFVNHPFSKLLKQTMEQQTYNYKSKRRTKG